MECDAERGISSNQEFPDGEPSPLGQQTLRDMKPVVTADRRRGWSLGACFRRGARRCRWTRAGGCALNVLLAMFCPSARGGSVPALVEADDLGLYVVKLRGASQGPKVLVAELLAGEIARAAGLLVPELVFVDLDRELDRERARSGDLRPARGERRAESGPRFSCPGASPSIPSRAPCPTPPRPRGS